MNRGAYTSPFSGVGTEFYPLGVSPDLSGMVLHETGYLSRNDWWVFPNVMSPFWRLYYNFDKGHKVIFGTKEYSLTPGHMMLIPDHQLFHCQGTTPVRNLWIAFSLARRLEACNRVPILLQPTGTELDLLRTLAGLFNRKKAQAFRTRIFHHSMAILNVVLCRPEFHWLNHPVQENMVAVVRHIETSLAQPLEVPGLALMAGLSLRGFSNAFKRHQGTSVSRFIIQVRVREAARLLTHSTETLDAIACKTGFPNRNYFSRVFRNITGESPALFRAKHGIQ